jgi:hypothetical protein
MKIVDKKGRVYYIDGYLLSILDIAKQRISKLGKDIVIILDGMPGSGKSTQAACIASYFDEDFSYDQIHFSPESFEKGLLEGRDYAPEIFDESGTGLRAKDWQNFMNRRLGVILEMIRYKHKPIILVIPSVFSLDKDIVLQRANMLLHCFSHRINFFYNYYSKGRLKRIIIKGYRERNYKHASPYFRGHGFRKFGHLDYDTYEVYKKEKVTGYLKIPANGNKKVVEKISDKETEIEIAMRLRKEGYSLRDIGKILNKHHQTIADMVDKGPVSLEK